MKLKRIIISRVDSIGDVMLTLPLTGVIKKHIPDAEIIFLGKSYTQSIIESCSHVDQFVNWDNIKSAEDKVDQFKLLQADTIIHVLPNIQVAALAQRARIKNRIGTSRRWFHHLYCNKLVSLSRRKSELHEAQLNIKLITDLLNVVVPDLAELPDFYGFNSRVPLKEEFKTLLALHPKNIILHPKSQGSAREWGLKNFDELIQLFAKEDVGVFITGTADEGKLIQHGLTLDGTNVYNMTGKMDLTQLISFIQSCDGLLAASTGPLHIAAALGKRTVGLYSPLKPIYPARWGALGKNTINLTYEGPLDLGVTVKTDHSMEKIKPQRVFHALMNPDS
ncbi:MAG: glycosyltransferase family 9 protein [Flavobacteriales bacterium]|nr:glycosyltransferase family 9 protein [Flavobacteriales bacterium]